MDSTLTSTSTSSSQFFLFLPLMSSPSLCANGYAIIRRLKQKPEHNGTKVKLVSREEKESGCSWVCRTTGDERTFRVKEINLYPWIGDMAEATVHEDQTKAPRDRKRNAEKQTESIPELRNLKTFVINLKRREDRRKNIEDLCQKLQLDYEIVEACDGREVRKSPGAKFEIQKKQHSEARRVRSSRAAPRQSAGSSPASKAGSSSASKRKVKKAKKEVTAKKAAALQLTRTQRAQAAKKIAARVNPREKPKGDDAPRGFSNLQQRTWLTKFKWKGESREQLMNMAMHRVKSSDQAEKGHELWGAVVLNKILEDPTLQYALILEDDCVLATSSPEQLTRTFNHSVREIAESYPDWQLIYLGGSVCTKVKKKDQEEWKINEHVMRACAVYLTHAFVIKRDLIPEILKNLREGFAADAAFVSWSKKAWKRKNYDQCFLFEPQLLKQPGEANRWKDSDIFAEGVHFKHAFEAETKGEEYSFSRACELRRRIKKQTIARKDDVNDQQTVYCMNEDLKDTDDAKHIAIIADMEKVRELEAKKKKAKKQEEEERKRKELVKKEEEEGKKKKTIKKEEEKVKQETTQAAEITAERSRKERKGAEKERRKSQIPDMKKEKAEAEKAKKVKSEQAKAKKETEEPDTAQPVRPNPKHSKKAWLRETVEPAESEEWWEDDGYDYQEETDAKEDKEWEEQETTQPSVPGLESKVLQLLKRQQEDTDFLKAIQNAGTQKMEMQKLFTRKRRDPIEALQEQMRSIVEGSQLNLRLNRAALAAVVSSAVEDGMVKRLRATVEKLQQKVFYESFRNKLVDCFMCALEYHFHVPEDDLKRLEAAMRMPEMSNETAEELQDYLGKGPSAPVGVVVEAGIGLLSTLLKNVKAATSQLQTVEIYQREQLTLIEEGRRKDPEAAASSRPSPPSSPAYTPSESGTPASARASPKHSEVPTPSAGAKRKDLPASTRDGGPQPKRLRRCSSMEPGSETSVDPMRQKLLAMSVKQLREKANELKIPPHLCMACLEKADLVEAHEGTDWVEYCNSFGPAKAKFLLEEKLPRAFAIGKELGIEFRLDRRIVHTVDVNTALLVAQRHHVADRFAELTLAAHFEQLEDPNDTKALASRLEALNVAPDELMEALKDPDKEARNWERTQEVRPSLRSGVPQFE
eukprot:s1756_g10.t2